MTTMDQIHRIRELYYGQDKSLTEIASLMHIVFCGKPCSLVFFRIHKISHLFGGSIVKEPGSRKFSA